MKKRMTSRWKKKLKKSPVQTLVNQITLERCAAINQAFSDYFNNPEDVEAVHQVRVKIRKLRGVLSFFKPLIINYSVLQSRLKKLADLFGDARESDVFLEEIGIIEALNQGQELPMLKKILLEKQMISRSKLSQELTRDAADAKMEEVAGLISKQELTASQDAIKAKSYMQREIKRWIKKTQKAVDGMNAFDPVSIHEVRIRCKKIRYVLESVSFMLSESEEKKLQVFETIQDDLGMVHDAYVNRDFLKALPDPDIELQQEISFFVGWQMGKAAQIMERYQF
ncbi:CHAD domain-containing protein [Eubacteriaceae bacterium ES2]|nr:CHAD domain-containing protein [Eubacteriaceae bacterium ES2]